MQLREVPENLKSSRQHTRMQGTPWPSGPPAKEDFAAVWMRAKSSPVSFALLPPGLTDDEIDLAFQQSGTATDEPPSLGLATPVAPIQPPHLIPQPYSKSPVPCPAALGLGLRTPGKSRAHRSHHSKLGELNFSRNRKRHT